MNTLVPEALVNARSRIESATLPVHLITLITITQKSVDLLRHLRWFLRREILPSKDKPHQVLESKIPPNFLARHQAQCSSSAEYCEVEVGDYIKVLNRVPASADVIRLRICAVELLDTSYGSHFSLSLWGKSMSVLSRWTEIVVVNSLILTGSAVSWRFCSDKTDADTFEDKWRVRS